mgnify:CR=1 FL=1
MDFHHSPRALALRQQLEAFMQQYLLPYNAAWHRSVQEGIYPPPFLEDLKALAREAGLWNLKQLAGALTLIGDLDGLTEAVRAYPPAFAHAQQAALLRRLGLMFASEAEDNRTMLDAMFAFMARSGISWDGFFHDWFGGLASDTRAQAGPRATFYQGEDFMAWFNWLDRF